MSQAVHLRKYGAEATIDFELYEIDGVDLKTDATLAAVDCEVQKDGGNFVQCTNTGALEDGTYSIVLTATEMEAARVVLKVVDAATKVFLDKVIIIEIYGHASAQHAFDLDIATPDINILSISGDSTAADNLELMYDGTGYTDDTAPSSRSQVGLLSTGSAAISTTAASRTLGGSEPETNTYTSTVELDGTYHIVEDDGGTTDIYYEFSVGGNGVPTEIVWDGYAQSKNDSYIVQAYNWGGLAWEQIGTIDGSNGTTLTSKIWQMTIAHVGTGTDLGKVRLKFYSTDGTAIATDRILCSYAVVAESVGYSQGMIWVDSGGTAAAEVYVNGVADNPCPWANALTLSGTLGINRFHIASGDTVTLTGDSSNYILEGAEWTLDLDGQTIDNTHIIDAKVSGIGVVSSGKAHFVECDMGDCTLGKSHFSACGFAGTITISAAEEYIMNNCYASDSGGGSPKIDFGAGVANTAVGVRDWNGGIEIRNLGQNGTDKFTIQGKGKLTIASTCTGGTIGIHGCMNILDNVDGGFAGTLNEDSRIADDTVGWTAASRTLTGADNITSTGSTLYIDENGYTQIEGTLNQLDDLNNFDPANDTVALVTSVGTVTTNTDMRGTNIADLNNLSAQDVWEYTTRTITGEVGETDATLANQTAMLSLLSSIEIYVKQN